LLFQEFHGIGYCEEVVDGKAREAILVVLFEDEVVLRAIEAEHGGRLAEFQTDPI
jgi:hypothetical protein